MKVVFRVDASLKMGIGHLMRCLTLANELRGQKHEIFFICSDLIGNLISKIQYPVYILPRDEKFSSENVYLDWLGSTTEYDSEQTIKVIPKNTDLLVIDSYALDKSWHRELRPFTKKIMVIDDLANKHFDCDILLNQNLGAAISHYSDKVPDDCKLFLGPKYSLLRSEFSDLRQAAIKKRKETKLIKNILISMGGIDSENITYNILNDISKNYNIAVVLGGMSPHNSMIKEYAKSKNNIKVYIDCDNLAKLMLDADLAIGAGGSTTWERCCLGLPTLLFVLSENQRNISNNLEQLGAVKIVKNIKIDVQFLNENFQIWKDMSSKAQSVTDGNGTKRIVYDRN
tara:strand:+ start:2538 stop:3563 length:1026 start_codon:yes stop_codon:yes gene_type:complete